VEILGDRLGDCSCLVSNRVPNAERDGRIEKELNIRLSTLERYVEALGGRVEIHAVFDDEDVKLTA
jgi:hypothetical protein